MNTMDTMDTIDAMDTMEHHGHYGHHGEWDGWGTGALGGMGEEDSRCSWGHKGGIGELQIGLQAPKIETIFLGGSAPQAPPKKPKMFANLVNVFQSENFPQT